MTVALRSLRVTAGMDAREYITGMNQKIAADKAGTASSAAVGAALARADAQANQSGGLLTKLSRQYVEGYGNAAKFESAVSSLGRGIEKGAVPLERVEVLLEGISRKYGLTADASALLANGQTVLANAAADVSARLAQEESALDGAAAAQRRLAEEHARMAELARAEQAAGAIQERYNSIYGIGNASGGTARDSATVFEAELSRMEEISRRKAEQAGQSFAQELNSRLVAGVEKSARESAGVFEMELDRLDDIARLKAQQAGHTFSQELNSRMGIGRSGTTARDSAAVFEAAAREEETFAAKAAVLRAQLDPLAAAQERLNAELLEYAALADRGAISSRELAAAHGMAQVRFQATADSLDKVAVASKNAGFQQRTLMFQVNDVFQSLALGMPISQVALQQGPQIAQIYGPGEGGIGRAFSETGKMITGVLTKFPAVTAAVALVGVGFAGLTYEINQTTEVTVGFGDTAQAVFEVIADRIYGTLQPAIASIAPWFQEAWDGSISGVKYLGNALVVGIKTSVELIRVSILSIPAAFRLAGEGAANGFLKGIEWMVQKALAGLKAIRDNLQAFSESTGAAGALRALGLNGDLPPVDTNYTIKPANFGGASARAELERLSRDAATNIAGFAKTDYMGGFFSDVRNEAIKNAQDDDKKKGGKTARERESDYERAIRRTQEQTKATAEETRVIDLSTYSRERQGAVQDILTAAQRDGLEIGKAFANAQDLINASSTSLSPALAQERQRVLDVAGAYAQAQADAEKAADAKQKFEENISFVKDTARGFIDDFSGAVKDGATVWEAFAESALKALDRVADKLLNDVLDAIFEVNEAGASGGGGGIFGMIASGIGSLFGGGGSDPWAGMRVANAKGNVFTSPSLSAYSGQVVDRPTYFAFAKGAGVMGEAGPEGIFPLRRDASGRLGISAANAANQNMPGVVRFEMNLNVSGNGDKELMSRIREGTEMQLREGFEQFSRNVLPGRVNQINEDPYAVGA